MRVVGVDNQLRRQTTRERRGEKTIFVTPNGDDVVYRGRCGGHRSGWEL